MIYSIIGIIGILILVVIVWLIGYLIERFIFGWDDIYDSLNLLSGLCAIILGGFITITGIALGLVLKILINNNI